MAAIAAPVVPRPDQTGRGVGPHCGYKHCTITWTIVQSVKRRSSGLRWSHGTLCGIMADMGNVATRLISIIMLLQSRGMLKASELAAELKVSERTIHRYMGMLDEMGVPIYSERGPYGGFALVRGYKLPPLIFTPEEATVLYLGAGLVRDVWGQSYRDAALSATAKLDNVLPDALRHEVDHAQQSLVVTGWHRLDYTPYEAMIDTLRRAVAQRRQVALTYQSFRQQTTERKLDPYGLALQWGLWYLVGHCHLRGEMRTFRVDRVLRATLLDECFDAPHGFDLQAYLSRMEAPPGPVYQVEVHFDAEAAPMVRERRTSSQTLVEQDDESVIVGFETRDLGWVVRWVLGYQAHARVLRPPDLAERVRRAAQEIAARYDAPGDLKRQT